MNRFLLFLVFLIGCSHINSQSCDLCGKWSFDRFEYAGHITTDCEYGAQHFYEKTSIKIDSNNMIIGEYDFEENATVFFIKTDSIAPEKFYMLDPDSIYVFADGCRFYFKKD